MQYIPESRAETWAKVIATEPDPSQMREFSSGDDLFNLAYDRYI